MATTSIGSSGVTFPDATVQATKGITTAVTSAVAGNGVAVSGATGAVTFSASCPSYNSVGSYALGWCTSGTVTAGSNYAAGTGTSQVQSIVFYGDGSGASIQINGSNSLSGTWKWMCNTWSAGNAGGLICRVA